MEDDFTIAAAGFPDPFRLLLRENAGSTNDEARALGEMGAEDGLVVLALRQLAGRGRRGAAWFSGDGGDSLAFSILLRPGEPKALWPRLALAAGLAVAEAVESCGLPAGIKWPNDIWIGRRKAAGILVEAGNDFVVVGIGLNVNTTGFPAEVAGIATSLRIESGVPHPLPGVLASIVGRFAIRHRQIGADFDAVLDGVRQRCVLTGHSVALTTARGPLSGTAAGIAAGGELLLQTPDALLCLMQADEVRIIETPV